MAAPQIPNWQRVLASMLGVPDTPAVNTFLTDWQRAEGGGAQNNPFNTTEPGFGTTGSYNSGGVKRYDTPIHGLQATAATLRNGRYGNILAALHAGNSPMAMAQALAASPWGTGSLVERMLGGSPAAGSSKGRTPASEVGSAGSTPAPAASLPANQQAIAALLMGNQVDFNSNQVQAPNLMALAQLRQASTPSTTMATGTPRQLAAATKSRPMKAGSPVVDLTSIGGQHPTEGLAGFPAHDYFAPAGTQVVAPVSGKVIRLSGHDPRLGPIEGPHGPLGWSVYIQGNDGRTYYLTHMGSRNVRVGETLKAGTPIGTVADYARYGTPSHIHMGVN